MGFICAKVQCRLQLAPDLFDLAKMGERRIDSERIEPNAVSTIHLREKTITEEKLVDGAVTAVKLADGSVGARQLAMNSVSTETLQKTV